MRVILSLLILAHLSAVFAPPMAFQSRGPRGLSPSVSKLLTPLAAYGQTLYLDRGYAFFAPDPGPPHLMRVEIAGATKNTASDIRWYPHLNDQRPRLLYHRHFMLAEFLNDSYQPKLPTEAAKLVGPELPLEELQVWRSGRQRYEMIVESMNQHLAAKFPDRDVKLDRVEHLLPDFVVYAANPMPLNDPPTYVVLEDIPITMETLLGARPTALPEPARRETVPAPSGEPVTDSDESQSEDDSQVDDLQMEHTSHNESETNSTTDPSPVTADEVAP